MQGKLNKWYPSILDSPPKLERTSAIIMLAGCTWIRRICIWITVIRFRVQLVNKAISPCKWSILSNYPPSYTSTVLTTNN
jgi:hypothetical protein